MAAIEKAKGILIGIEGAELSPKAYGGYAFSANYSINFTQPSKLTISLVSKDGEYDTKALNERIFPGEFSNGNVPRSFKSFEHTVKSGETIQSISIKYSVHEAALYTANQEDGESDLQTINRLSSLFKDQVLVVPTQQAVTPISFEGGAITYDIIKFGGKTFKMHPLKYSIAQGPDGRYLQIDYYDRSIKYLDKTLVVLRGKHLPPVYDPSYPPFAGAPIATPPNTIAIGNGYVNAREFQSGPPGQPGTGTPQQILPTYLYSPAELYNGMLSLASPGGWLNGVIDTDSCALLASFYNTYRSDFLKDHVGTLREVLAAWAQDLGFIFYWEPTEDRLKLMDLRSDLTFNKIQQTVGKVVDARNMTDRNWSYSIEDTFSKGAAAYFGRNGIAEGRSSVDSFYMLDLMEIDLHKCRTDAFAITCGAGGNVYNKPDYCDDPAGEPEKPWLIYDMNNIRGDKDEFLAYIRLLKAAAIGSEFYKIYVLNKKAVSNTDKFPDYNGNHQPISTQGQAINAASLPSTFFDTDGNETLSGNDEKNTIGIVENEVVNSLYESSDADDFNYILDCKNTDGDVENSYLIGNDCLSIELLRRQIDTPSGKKNIAQVDQLYKLSAANLINASNTGDEINGSPYYYFRIKKNGLRAIVNSSEEDHIFTLLQGIANNQGRFYYSRQLQTAEQFSKKSYDLKNVRWIDRAVDVNDTPFGELYNSADPQASIASVAMPNDCIDGKDRDSKQTKNDGTAFTDPANTARPTVEQFIQSVYNDTLTTTEEGTPAILNVTVAGGAITSISVSQGGENYLDGGSGTAGVLIEGAVGAGADATATIEDGTVTSVTVDLGGAGYDDTARARVIGGVDNVEETNVFGQSTDIYGPENFDSILQSNLTERNETVRRDCGKTDDRLGVVIADMGSTLKIPNLIRERIDRHVKSLAPIPLSAGLDIVKYHNEAGYMIVSMAKPVDINELKTSDQYKGWFKEREDQGIEPKDELDFIVDQVEIPNLDNLLNNAKNKVSVESTYREAGDVFEARAMIRPLHESNVREVNMEFLTPAEKDLGVRDAQCIDDPDKQEAKRKQDDQIVAGNIAAYANAFAYQQPRVEYNAQVTVVDDTLRDTDGDEITVTVEKGLESIGAKLSKDGTELSYTVGTRRKRRVINKPFEDLWVRVKPEFYNNIFDI